MDFAVDPASVAEKTAFANLIELYLHDMSVYSPEDVGDDGRFRFDRLDSYWDDERRFPFLARADGRLAGFALVHKRSHFNKDLGVTDMAEFFVMRRYRRHGLGRFLATAMFDRFPGRWEVRELAANQRAQEFWRDVIGKYTDGAYEERTFDDESWRGVAQFFLSPARKPTGIAG